MKRFCSLASLALIIGGFNFCVGALIVDPITPVVALTGTGAGAVQTILSIQNTPSELGSVTWNGSSDVVSDHASPSQSQTYTVAQSGWEDPADVGIVFNTNEPGNAPDWGIQLDALELLLFSPKGTSFELGLALLDPILYPNASAGSGTSGYLFSLNPPQQFDLLDSGFLSNPVNRIGFSATVSLASSGAERFFLIDLDRGGGGGGAEIPEPGTVILIGAGLGALLLLRRLRAVA